MDDYERQAWERVGTIERTIELPYGYRVKLLMNENGFDYDWKPSYPEFRNRKAESKFWAKYYTARNEFMQDVVDALGAELPLLGTDGLKLLVPTQGATEH